MLTDSVLYLYGFVRSSVDRAALARAGADVLLVECDDVACAARVVSAIDYHIPPDAKSAEHQLEWVAPRAWQHHEVLRQLHAEAAVVPLKFGTLCPDMPHLTTMLRRLRNPILELLDRFDGKDEWTLNLYADTDLLAAIVQHSVPEIASMSETADRLPEGHAYFVRKKLRQATADAVAARLAAVERSVHERLEAIAVAIAAESRPHTTPTAGPDASVSILVTRARFAELEALLTELEATHAEGHVTFELVGPWPPYSFAAGLELKEPASE